jgi:hypothetical protein
MACADWEVVYIGDEQLSAPLRRLLFPAEVTIEPAGRVSLWDIPRTTTRLLHEVDLVVCALGRRFPQRWRPNAPIHFVSPIEAQQVLDIRPPLEELLRGKARREVRYHVQRADALGLRARITRATADLACFYDELYRPHLVQRHGDFAVINPISEHQHWLDAGGELLLVEHEGVIIAGTLLRYYGQICSTGEEGLRHDIDPAVYAPLQTALWRMIIDRAQERGCTSLIMGHSPAQQGSPIYRAKRRWGAVTRPIVWSGAPEWTFLAADPAPALIAHLNACELISFPTEHPCTVQIGGNPPRATLTPFS